MSADYYGVRRNHHIACRAHGGDTIIHNLYLTAPLISLGGGRVKAIIQHQILTNAGTVHALENQVLPIGQIQGAIIGNILHYIGVAIFEDIAATRLLIHGHHSALMLHIADNPAIGVKIRSVDGCKKPFLAVLLGNTSTPIISTGCRKGLQLVFSSGSNAH